MSGVHAWGCGTSWCAGETGLTGISIQQGRSRLLGCYLDFNYLDIANPTDIIVSNSFFLGTHTRLIADWDAVAKHRAPGMMMGFTMQGNSLNAIELIGNFSSPLARAHIEDDNVPTQGNMGPPSWKPLAWAGMKLTTVHRSNKSTGPQQRFDFNFSSAGPHGVYDTLLLPEVDYMQYSVAFDKAQPAPVHHYAEVSPSATVSVVFDKPVVATVYMEARCCMGGQQKVARVTPSLLKTDDFELQFEPPVRVGAGANMENVYALSHTHLLTNAGNQFGSNMVTQSQTSGRSWELASVGSFVPPGVRNYMGVLGPSRGIGPYWYRSADGQHLRDYGSIVESMGSRDNFSAFNSSSVDEISLDPSSPTGFRARKITSQGSTAVEIVGFSRPLRCGQNMKKSYRVSPGGCPMYLQDSGSAVLAGPPQTLVQLAEVAFADYDDPFQTNNTVVCFTSTDGGRRWNFVSVVANASWFTDAQEGPSGEWAVSRAFGTPHRHTSDTSLDLPQRTRWLCSRTGRHCWQ